MVSKRTKATKKSSQTVEESNRDESVRMNVNIPKSFHKQIKQKALDEDVTITELVIKALKEYLNK